LAVPSLCELYPGICLTTEEKARKNLSQGSRRDSKNAYYQDIHTLQNPPIHTHTHTPTHKPNSYPRVYPVWLEGTSSKFPDLIPQNILTGSETFTLNSLLSGFERLCWKKIRCSLRSAVHFRQLLRHKYIAG
jgi:hypothetical protein